MAEGLPDDTNKINVSEQNYVSISSNLLDFTTKHREAIGNVYPFIRQKAISLQKLELNKDKFVSQLLFETMQVMGGYRQDETWSDYDESIGVRTLELLELINKTKEEK